jgi:gluconokinase
MTPGTVSLADRHLPLVLTLDLGSSSLRCGVYDGAARSVAGMEAKFDHRLKTGRNGSSTADPDALLNALFGLMDTVLERLGPAAADIAAVGSCTFVANVLGIDASGRPVTPLTTYADTTSWAQANRLSADLDQEDVRQRVGCYFHPSYLPSRFLLWQKTDATIFRKVARWATLGEYMEQTLFGPSGRSGVTYSVASWTGLLNRHTLDWDEELVHYLSVDKATLPRLTDVNASRVGLLPQFAARWPTLGEVSWFPAIGDGAAANLGSAKPDAPCTVVVTLGTTGAVRAITRAPIPQIPDGLWCYRVDKDRLLPGGALTEGGNVHAWLRETLRLDDPDRLEQAVAAMRPDAHGLSFLPFFAGERSPGWRGRAKATVHGLTLATTPLDMLRAGMESVAFRLGLICERLLPLLALSAETTPVCIPIVAGGRALVASPVWAQMLADVLGCRVEVCGIEETSSRGVALLMLSFLDALPASSDIGVPGTVLRPDHGAHAIYKSARERQIRLYDFIRRHDDTQEEAIK